MRAESSVPFSRPHIGGREIRAVENVLRSGWLTAGPQVEAFESAFAARVRAQHAVAVNSCTAALHLSLLAAGIGPGDEVLVPTMTFASGAGVVCAVGATPVLIDCEPDTLCMDLEHAEAAITSRTRAIMPMHYGGNPFDLVGAMALQESRPSLLMIEDAAHAFSASHELGPIGSIGDLTCFSFYANKPLTTGEGGMLTTNDAGLAERARRLSRHGISTTSHTRHLSGAAEYDIGELGYKYAMSDITAAIGIAQLEQADGLRDQRCRVVAEYDTILADIEGLRRVAKHRAGGAAHLYVVELVGRTQHGRDQVRRRLSAKGIGTSVHYRPLHEHSFYWKRLGLQPEDLPVASSVSERIISLPLFPGMTSEQVELVRHELVDALASQE